VDSTKSWIDSTLGGLVAENPCSTSFFKTPSESSDASSLSGLLDAENALYIAVSILSVLKFEIDPSLLRTLAIEFSICDFASSINLPIQVIIDIEYNFYGEKDLDLRSIIDQLSDNLQILK
jgi:hypothetical protein